MFRPTFGKLAVPIVLTLLAIFSTATLRMTLFAILGVPFFYTVGLPFPYSDKPWYVSPRGAMVIGVVWAILIYGVTCLISARRRGDAKI